MSAFAVYDVSPTSTDFGTVTVGSSSGASTVTFTSFNTSGLISFSSISASGSYSITNNCPMIINGLSLGPGASCTVNVVFTPQASGAHNGQLTFVGSDEGIDFTAQVALSGIGVANQFGSLSFSPSTLNFGSTTVDSTSSSVPVILTNTGNASVSINTITTTAPFAQSNDCPSQLSANSDCTIMVSATPTTTGTVSESLTVDATGPQGAILESIPLNVEGIAPDLVVSDTTLSFPDSTVDTSSQPLVVTVTNQGTASLMVNSITTEGDFSQTNDCGTEIAAGSSCDIQVVFTPQSPGAASGALNIDTSDGLSRIVLSGSADAAPSTNPVADLLRPFSGDNPNILSLIDVIAEACPSGRLSDRLQEDCNAVVGAAIDGDTSTQTALFQVSPETATKANTTSRQGSETQIRNLGTRISALRAGVRGLSFNGLDLRIDDQNLPIELIADAYRNAGRRGGGASADNQLLASRLGVFVTGDISTGERDETDLETGLDFDTVGITIGADYRITNQFILGGAVGFIDTEAELENDAGDLDTQGVSLSLFGTYYSPQNYFVDFSATVGKNDFDQKRSIVYTLGGLADVSQELKADYDGDTVSLFIGSGYDFNRGAWSFGPRADLEYIKSDVDGFTEEVSDPTADGGGWATRVEDTDQRWLTLNLGGKVSYTHSADWGVLIPYARLDWLHEFEDDSQVITAHFIEDPAGMGIEIQTDDPDRDYLRLRFGTSAQFQNGVVGFIDFGTILAHSEWSAHTISAGLRMEF
ncbi:MAG: autotransporter domain-containing protein [Candidatus Thiodiazotropha sp. (ex. Lucinisca nassula)]|nr:autotransporter domain-containing protein [Candidatus Thiodiazotropha sp. (ex. Lucinisca nassula)]